MARGLNKVTLIGNLTRDPELKYTPSGSAVCTFGLATNRQWTTENGEKHDEADFHNIVAWGKLAELCSKLLKKGSKAFVSGRLSCHKFKREDGTEASKTEIVMEDMITLSHKEKEESDELSS